MPSSPHYSPVQCIINKVNLDCLSSPGNDFVSISDGFKFVFRYVVNHYFFATPSRTKWNAIIGEFFFKVECDKDVLANTDWLSPKTIVHQY